MDKFKSLENMFRVFPRFAPCIVQNRVIQFLMSRELVQDREHEFYVKINHNTLCVEIREFAIILVYGVLMGSRTRTLIADQIGSMMPTFPVVLEYQRMTLLIVL